MSASKKYRVRIQKEAVDELDRLYHHISKEFPTRARSFLKQLKGKILSLKNFPSRGSRAKILEEQDLEIRFIDYKGQLILYTIHEKEVVVLHISGPGQNWMEVFF